MTRHCSVWDWSINRVVSQKLTLLPWLRLTETSHLHHQQLVDILKEKCHFKNACLIWIMNNLVHFIKESSLKSWSPIIKFLDSFSVARISTSGSSSHPFFSLLTTNCLQSKLLYRIQFSHKLIKSPQQGKTVNSGSLPSQTKTCLFWRHSWKTINFNCTKNF